MIATVFNGVDNRMESGYLLRDVINKVNGHSFHVDRTKSTRSAHYTNPCSREMRDAAGDSGEFYTPRAVVRFMVEVTDPRLGETVLDPACGTGGFLVEAFEHLRSRCKTVAGPADASERQHLRRRSQAAALLLCQMNLLLHGMESPQIDPGQQPGAASSPRSATGTGWT